MQYFNKLGHHAALPGPWLVSVAERLAHIERPRGGVLSRWNAVRSTRIGVAVPDAAVHAGRTGGASRAVPYVAAEFCPGNGDLEVMSGCLCFCLSCHRDFQRRGADLRGVRFHRLRDVYDNVVDPGLHCRHDLCLLRRGPGGAAALAPGRARAPCGGLEPPAAGLAELSHAHGVGRRTSLLKQRRGPTVRRKRAPPETRGRRRHAVAGGDPGGPEAAAARAAASHAAGRAGAELPPRGEGGTHVAQEDALRVRDRDVPPGDRRHLPHGAPLPRVQTAARGTAARVPRLPRVPPVRGAAQAGASASAADLRAGREQIRSYAHAGAHALPARPGTAGGTRCAPVLSPRPRHRQVRGTISRS
ncbi:hypothetical protein ON010_g2393 [Phytophthora cinnamomi]|nr:hypothetical protein ON010_g2393 [Phytophthora cinnamomi]